MKLADKGLMETASETTANVASELSKTMHEAGRLGSATTRLADQTVRDNPWRAIGLAAGVAFVIGLLMRRH